MSYSKMIASRLNKFRCKEKVYRARQTLKHGSNRFGIERLEDRQLMAADFVPGEILVQYAPDVTPEMRAQMRPAGSFVVETIHTAMMQRSGAGVIEQIQLGPNTSVADAVTLFSQQNGVVVAEPNYVYDLTVVSNDPLYTNGSLWGMYGDDASISPGVPTNSFGSQAEKAWNNDQTGSSNVYVGIIDTGIQWNHPDLIDNMWTNPFDPVDGIDNDGNGYTDDTQGWDFARNDNSIFDNPSDDSHGTHVAGTIGGTGGNSTGVAGVNWDVTMIPLRIFYPFSMNQTIKAYDYLTDLKVRHGLDVVASNNSWRGYGYSALLHAAINRGAKADILMVGAAANDSINNDTNPAYPASYNTLNNAVDPSTGNIVETAATYDGVISVAAIDSNGNMAGFSNFGITSVDIGAPGVGITSTWPTNSYNSINGTSMAAPHVAGAAALYKSVHATATAKDIRSALLQGARATPSLNGRVATGGRLDVAAALAIPPKPDIVIVDASVLEGDAGITQMQFTVSLSRPTSGIVTVDYRTRQDTATAGIDYVSTTGTLSFNPGETFQTIVVDVVGDLDVEPIERFFVDILNATNGIITDPLAIGTIYSEDLPKASVADVSIVEGNSGVKALYFTVTLSDLHSQNVSMLYRTVDGTAKSGSDYRGVNGTLVIPAGARTGTIRVDILGDTIIEDNEIFYLELEAAAQADLIDSTAIATISNDDTEQGLSISDSSTREGNSGRKSMFFSISLAQPSTSFITIHYATVNGSATTADRDYVAVSGQVSIRPGGRSAIIEVPILGDRKVETDENFFVQLVRAFGATISDGIAEGIIVNDDVGRALPPVLPSGFGALSDTGSGSSGSALGLVSGASSSAAISTTPSSRQPSASGSPISSSVFGPRRVASVNMTQALAMGSPIGPRTSDSFASAVDLALIALLKDNERMLRLR